MGFALRFRPTYAGANVGHPSGIISVLVGCHFLAIGLGARMAHAYCIERVVGEEVESAAIFASEEDVVRALGHCYGA